MIITARCVNTAHPDFIGLIRELDNEMYQKYGEVYLSYMPHNTPADLLLAVVVCCNGLPVACGGLKRLDTSSAELKRIFVSPRFRRVGLAQRAIRELEDAALLQGYSRIVLETGTDMNAAISLYKKLGYNMTDNYGPYVGDSACVCMAKRLAREATP